MDDLSFLYRSRGSGWDVGDLVLFILLKYATKSRISIRCLVLCHVSIP